MIWQGATPGKRICRLRVVDRRGGPLEPSAIVARNLTREIEAFMPLGLLLSLGHGAGLWQQLAITVWLLLFSALPFFNRDRMRAGDFIGGTMVIAVPRRVLLGDLVEGAARYAFTIRQLSSYGAFELQILEELLRRPASDETRRLLNDVGEKICRKIAWTPPPSPAEMETFLREFYTAERAYLERQQLFGKQRADKHSKPTA
jgi:hypothetical protein